MKFLSSLIKLFQLNSVISTPLIFILNKKGRKNFPPYFIIKL
ncbi:hypothetical protein HMPREF9094_0922 [Fusobacterium animalis ATCC 51191]|uniref:Uncharacterized protein n=1 Tax=Fusobacterium animalis ATCC 51191 TaxID=997347 RepID=F9ELW7_9FUSO|nr:hypothetical protein HMPREF9094_0922 [Fusobacterium animalis ATCC 51191]